MLYKIASFMLTTFLSPNILAEQEGWILTISGNDQIKLMCLSEQDGSTKSPETRINPICCYKVENNALSEKQIFDSNSLQQFNQLIATLFTIPQAEITFAGIELQPIPITLNHEITAIFPLFQSLLTPGCYFLHREYLNSGTWFILEAQDKKTLSLYFDKNNELAAISFGQISPRNIIFLSSQKSIKPTSNRSDDDPAGGAAGAIAARYAQMAFNQPPLVSLKKDKPLWTPVKPGSPAEQLSPTGSIIDFLAELFLHTTK